MKRGLVAAIGGALALVTWVSTASAAPSEEEHKRAAQSFREAQSSFERRDYAAAAAAFEQAAELEPHPAPLLNAAEAWLRSGDAVRAAQDCDRVLATAPLEDRYRAEAEHRLAAVADKIATIDLRGPRTVSVQIDGGAAFPLPARRRVAPGFHALAIVDVVSGQTRNQSITATPGEPSVLDFTPPKATVERDHDPVVVAPRAPSSNGSSFPAAAWVTAGVSVAAVATTTIFGVMTVHSRDDFSASPTPAARDAFYRNRTLTNISLGVAAAGAVATVVLWKTLGRSSSVAVQAQPEGAMLVGRMSFHP